MNRAYKPGEQVILRDYPLHDACTVKTCDPRGDRFYVTTCEGASGPAEDFAPVTERDAVAKARRAVPVTGMSDNAIAEATYDGRMPNDVVARHYGPAVARLYGGGR